MLKGKGHFRIMKCQIQHRVSCVGGVTQMCFTLNTYTLEWKRYFCATDDFLTQHFTEKDRRMASLILGFLTLPASPSLQKHRTLLLLSIANEAVF